MKNNDIDSLEDEIKEGSGIMEGVEIAIFNDKGQILLGKRLASAGFGTWNIPGGHLRTNEKISECALREIREELGENIDVEITGEIISVRENAIPPHRIHHVTIIIKGNFRSGVPAVNEPEKCEKWEWFDLENLPSPLFSGVKDTLENYRKGTSAVVSDW